MRSWPSATPSSIAKSFSIASMAASGQVTEIGMHDLSGEQCHRFAVRADRAVRARPGVGDFGSVNIPDTAGCPASTRRFIQARAVRTASENVEDTTLGIPALAQKPTLMRKIATRTERAGHGTT